MHQDYPTKLPMHQFPRGKSLLVQQLPFTQIALNSWERKFLCKTIWNRFSFLVQVLIQLFFFPFRSGQLSPENLSKALNQTQIAAADYYSWLHKKIDVYAKIKW